MKVLHVSTSPGFDGHHARIVREVAGLTAAGFNVTLHKPDPKNPRDRRKDELPDLSGFDVVHTHNVHGTRVVERALERILERKRPKFVQGVHFNGGYAGGMARVSALADAVVCVSEHDAAELKAANPDIADKIRCIYTGIDPSLYGKGTRDSVVIGMYGSGTRKGQDVFEAVARELTQYRFEIAGARGTDTDNLKYLGRLEPETFRAWLAGLSVYVQPSRAEALGTSLLEAGASYCACIGSDAGGIPEVVIPGVTGILVTAGDEDSLAKAVAKLADNEQLRKSYGTAMRTHVQAKFTAAQMVEKTATLYREVTA